MKLSILIPTLINRTGLFERVYRQLSQQRLLLKKPQDCEIIYYRDSGRESIGAKRNKLIEEAQGDYIAFVDDDDKVSENYLEFLLNAIKDSPDCVQLNGVMTTNGANPRKFIHSLSYNSYFEKDRVYFRPPNHLNCLKKSLVKDFKFQEINFGEDTEWAMRVCKSGVLKTEFKHQVTLYYYQYMTRKNF